MRYAARLRCRSREAHRAERHARSTHGVARLASYVEMMNQGLLNPRPKMSHETRGGAIVFEADGALGHVAAPEIIALALGALKTQASVLVVVREIGHLGSLGIHALAAAEAGAFCLVGQQAPPVMAMRGFRERRSETIRSPLPPPCRTLIPWFSTWRAARRRGDTSCSPRERAGDSGELGRGRVGRADHRSAARAPRGAARPAGTRGWGSPCWSR